MEYNKLNRVSKSIFRSEATCLLTADKGYIVDKIIKTEEGLRYNPEVDALAEEIYNMDHFVFDKRYMYPVCAGEFLDRFEIVDSENGVEILCDDSDRLRIKKAIAQLVFPATGSKFDNLKTRLLELDSGVMNNALNQE